MKIGLARVSTRDQHPEAQEDPLRAAGCEKVFTDKAPGTLARRPGLDKALMIARRGDQIVVTKLDRLGRSLEHLIDWPDTGPGARTRKRADVGRWACEDDATLTPALKDKVDTIG